MPMSARQAPSTARAARPPAPRPRSVRPAALSPVCLAERGGGRPRREPPRQAGLSQTAASASSSARTCRASARSSGSFAAPPPRAERALASPALRRLVEREPDRLRVGVTLVPEHREVVLGALVQPSLHCPRHSSDGTTDRSTAGCRIVRVVGSRRPAAGRRRPSVTVSPLVVTDTRSANAPWRRGSPERPTVSLAR